MGNSTYHQLVVGWNPSTLVCGQTLLRCWLLLVRMKFIMASERTIVAPYEMQRWKVLKFFWGKVSLKEM